MVAEIPARPIVAPAFSVREDAPNVHVVDWKITNNSEWVGEVLVRGDAHHDNPHSKHAIQKRHLDQALERGAAILDVGDLFCAMGGRYDPRNRREGITRREHIGKDDYFDSIVGAATRFHAPYARNWLVLAKGNHESAVLKSSGTDLTQRLAEGMSAASGCKVHAGGYGGWVVFNFANSYNERASIRLNYFHGSGGGGMMSFGTLNVRRRASWLADADICVSGHVHESWQMSISRRSVVRCKDRYRVASHEMHHVCTPSYKEEWGDGSGGWQVERGGPPKPIGAWWMRFRFERAGSGKSRKCRIITTFEAAR